MVKDMIIQTTRLTINSTNENNYSVELDNAEIGKITYSELEDKVYNFTISIIKEYQKNGYAYEASYSFFEYLFRDLKANKIVCCSIDDKASKRLCNSLSMKKTVNINDYTISKQDWDAKLTLEAWSIFGKED